MKCNIRGFYEKHRRQSAELRERVEYLHKKYPENPLWGAMLNLADSPDFVNVTPPEDTKKTQEQTLRKDNNYGTESDCQHFQERRIRRG